MSGSCRLVSCLVSLGWPGPMVTLMLAIRVLTLELGAISAAIPLTMAGACECSRGVMMTVSPVFWVAL